MVSNELKINPCFYIKQYIFGFFISNRSPLVVIMNPRYQPQIIEIDERRRNL